MKFLLKQLSIVACVFLLLSPAAQAFDPYIGEHISPCRGNDFLRNKKKKKPKVLRCTTNDTNAVANIQNTGGPFDAQVTVQSRSGRNRKTYVITLNDDGTGTCTVDGRLIAGEKRAATINGVAPGSKVTIQTRTEGTWTLGEGVRTTLAFEGETNGIPTTITGFMDLTDEGKYILNLTTTYENGNNLFAKPSVIDFGP